MTFSFIEEQLEQRNKASLLRSRHCIEVLDDQYINVDGQTYLNFSSNDYLGLNNHPKINQALTEGAQKFGASSVSSSLVTGFNYAHQALEAEICDWLNKERCLLFNSGFSANFGVLQAFKSNNVQLILDKLSHASLIDGGHLASAANQLPLKRFKHNDMQHLSSILSKLPQGDQLIVTESIFSMDGDCSPLKEISGLASVNNTSIYVDDAHGIGVIGDKGEGACSVSQNTFSMLTFGKALATQGAAFTCDQQTHDFLLNFCRDYIYSTAMSPAVAWATIQSIKLAQTESWRRDNIKELSQTFKNELDSSISLLPTDSSIHAIVVGDDEKAMRISKELKSKGYWLTAIRPPTVPKGTSRLRVTICQNHKLKDIKRLAQEINKAMM